MAIPRVTKSKDADAITDDEVLGRCQEIASVFKTVERMLLNEEPWHVQAHDHSRLRTPATGFPVLAREQARASLHPVDEFQDANFAQVKIFGFSREGERLRRGRPGPGNLPLSGCFKRRFGLFHRHFEAARLWC